LFLKKNKPYLKISLKKINLTLNFEGCWQIVFPGYVDIFRFSIILSFLFSRTLQLDVALLSRFLENFLALDLLRNLSNFLTIKFKFCASFIINRVFLVAFLWGTSFECNPFLFLFCSFESFHWHWCQVLWFLDSYVFWFPSSCKTIKDLDV